MNLELTSQDLKERGQALTRARAGNEWVERTLSLLKDWCVVRKASGQREFRFEEFRAFCEDNDWSAPVSHHVWGALPATAARRGVIRFTGRYEKAKSLKTHAHDVKVWECL